MSNKDERLRALLSRRDFLKIVIVSGSAIATASLIKLLDSESIDSVLATSGTGPYYYGTDTSWAVDTKGTNASNFPQNFYIGRTGVGELIYNDSSFYPIAADKAGYYYTHTYWNLKGPYIMLEGAVHDINMDLIKLLSLHPRGTIIIGQEKLAERPSLPISRKNQIIMTDGETAAATIMFLITELSSRATWMES